MSDAEIVRDIAALSESERLARAVLLFHGSDWSDEKREQWIALTGQREATTRVLCDLARRTLVAAVAKEIRTENIVAGFCAALHRFHPNASDLELDLGVREIVNVILEAAALKI
jgi:hypothetical protein